MFGFLLIIRILVLIGMVRLLVATGKPLLCAGIYAVVSLILRFSGYEWYIALVLAPISFGLAFLYFWLLDRLQGGTLFWAVMIVGFVIGIV